MMSEKLFPKSRRRHAVWYWMAFSFAFCIGLLLGVNIAFLIFASTSVVLTALLFGLSGGVVFADGASVAISLLLGGAFLLGYIWTFAGASSTYEAAKAYEEANGIDGVWPRALVVGLEVFFIALDLISLFYRREFFSSKGADQLFWFFLVLSLLSPVLGLLMHILENKPLTHRLVEAQRHATNLVGDDLQGLIETMPFELRAQAISGDATTAIREHLKAVRGREKEAYDAVEARREEKETRKQEKLERKRNAQRPLVSGSLAQLSQASQSSPNDQQK